MRVLALDIATVTGFAAVELFDGSWIALGGGIIDVKPLTKDEPEGVRFHRFRELVTVVLDEWGPYDAVAIEQPFSNRMRTAQVLSGLTAVALVELEERGWPYVFVGPRTWKKHVAGSGSASKDEVRAALNGWLEITAECKLDENHSDALGIARWLIETSLQGGS